jgi:hypothetical protein
MEIFLGKKIPNPFKICFDGAVSPSDAQEIWSEVVLVIAPLCVHLSEAFADGLKNVGNVQRAIIRFKSLVAVTAGANAPLYRKFAAHF